MNQVKFFPAKIFRTVAIIAFFFPYTMSFGDEEGSLTIYNHTVHFVHVIMNNDSYLYVGPGRSVSETTDEQATLYVQAFYAPGQGIEGSAQRTFTIGGHVYKTDCSSGNSTCATDPAFASASWTITADSLVAGPHPGDRKEMEE